MSDGIYCYIVVYDGALGNEGLLSLFSMLIFGACLSCLSPMHTQNVEKKNLKHCLFCWLSSFQIVLFYLCCGEFNMNLSILSQLYVILFLGAEGEN